MKSLYPLTLAPEPMFSSFSGVFREAYNAGLFVLNKELWLTAFYISPWRPTIHIIGTKYSALSADDTPYQLSHLHISFIPSFSLHFFKWQRWPKGMILRTRLLSITRLNFERMKSIPFAFKYQNMHWNI